MLHNVLKYQLNTLVSVKQINFHMKLINICSFL